MYVGILNVVFSPNEPPTSTEEEKKHDNDTVDTLESELVSGKSDTSSQKTQEKKSDESSDGSKKTQTQSLQEEPEQTAEEEEPVFSQVNRAEWEDDLEEVHKVYEPPDGFPYGAVEGQLTEAKVRSGPTIADICLEAVNYVLGIPRKLQFVFNTMKNGWFFFCAELNQL